MRSRNYFTPIRMAIFKKNQKTKPRKLQMLTWVWRNWNLVHCLWEYKMVQLLWKTVWWFLKKLNIELLHNPAILSTYPKELKVGPWTDICIPMFIAAKGSM